ncbi:MAG: VCBS repeat-containing protein, partial [Caldilineaceae bacterium]|nr:VCBS repeat-containing protein [Caldilineaceae bacterium]
MQLQLNRLFALLLAAISLLVCFYARDNTPVKGAPPVQISPTTSVAAIAPANFVAAAESVGITAPHQGSWEEYSEFRAFTDGYLAMGQAWGDYDNDGWVDLYVTGGQGPSTLYQNLGNGRFMRSPLADGVSLPNRWTGGAVWADYDNDGWRDLYVLAHGANVLLHNDGGAGFSDMTTVAGVGDPGKSSTATWGDFNGDGYLDLYVTNWSCYPACDPVDDTQAQDHLYQSNGPNEQGQVTFTDASFLLTYEKLLGAGFAATFVDIDDDRDPDLYVVNDKLYN